jgi:hypothetical protein
MGDLPPAVTPAVRDSSHARLRPCYESRPNPDRRYCRVDGRASAEGATYVNVMDQSNPCYRAERYPPMDRSPTPDEYAQALAGAHRAGLHRFDRPRHW